MINYAPIPDPSFTVTPTCDGGTVVITGDPGGTFTFNPIPTDGAVIDTATGEVTGGTSGFLLQVALLLPTDHLLLGLEQSAKKLIELVR